MPTDGDLAWEFSDNGWCLDAEIKATESKGEANENHMNDDKAAPPSAPTPLAVEADEKTHIALPPAVTLSGHTGVQASYMGTYHLVHDKLVTLK